MIKNTDRPELDAKKLEKIYKEIKNKIESFQSKVELQLNSKWGVIRKNLSNVVLTILWRVNLSIYEYK